MSGHALAACAVILLSALHGWMAFGWSDWAMISKAAGFLMLLCYAMTGALIVLRAGRRGWSMLLLTFAAVAAGLVLLDVGITILVRSGWTGIVDYVGFQISGFSQNPNAFAFALLLALAALVTLRLPLRLHGALIGIMVVGLWFSGSRSGLVTMLALIGAALVMRLNARAVLAGCGIGILSLIAISQVPLLVRLILALLGSPVDDAIASMLIVMGRDTAGSTLQHLMTVQDGFAMFLSHPLFGAGLGAYVAEQMRTTATPLIIHSTPVWLLAETGALGFALFLWPAARIVTAEWPRRVERPARLLILILGVLALMSQLHELLYQRGFWLLLGATLAIAARPQPGLEKG
jgi:hypothetical protein